MHGYSARENRETPLTPDGHDGPGRVEKAVGRTSTAHVDGESDGRVLPTKGPNANDRVFAEAPEGRRPTKENTEQPTASWTQSQTPASSALLGVREVARRKKQTRFTALLHHVTVEQLQASFYALKRAAAPGVDGVTWAEYEMDLGARVTALHSRVHQGTYRALPSKRAYIPKPDGRQRPLGIAALEDKIVQHAVGTVLNQPETFDFLGFTHICGTTRKTGRFIVKRQTIRRRFSAKLAVIKEALRRRWHEPVPMTGRWLNAVVRGYFNYHAVPGNMDSLNSFRTQVIWRWYRALRRRGQRRRLTWARFLRLVDAWIPSARILHPHPNVRFDAMHPR